MTPGYVPVTRETDIAGGSYCAIPPGNLGTVAVNLPIFGWNASVSHGHTSSEYSVLVSSCVRGVLVDFLLA